MTAYNHIHAPSRFVPTARPAALSPADVPSLLAAARTYHEPTDAVPLLCAPCAARLPARMLLFDRVTSYSACSVCGAVPNLPRIDPVPYGRPLFGVMRDPSDLL